LGVYKVQGQTQEEFVAIAVQVKMQRCHFYTTRHEAKAANAAAAYRAKHEIVDTDMG
jgi:thiamine pyrophosphate-dependent acetolactate synthase large subunit-like protein